MTRSSVRVKGLGLVAVWAGIQFGCEQLKTPIAYGLDAGVNTGWTVMPAGTGNLNAVSGASDSAVWMVGDQGAILRWDGVHLVPEPSGTNANLRGVCAVDSNNAYAVGDGGLILQRSPSGWQIVAQGLTRQVLTAVWADTQRVVAVGSFGTVVFGTPAGGYALVPSGRAENLLGVSGTPGGNMTIVGSLGLILTFDGTNFSRPATPPSAKLLAGIAAVGQGIFMVGQEGTFYSLDGSSLAAISGCPQTPLRALSGVGGDVWAVGWDGTICGMSGGVVLPYPYLDARWFNGVYVATTASIWVVGANGTLLHGFPLLPDGGGLGVPDGGDQ